MRNVWPFSSMTRLTIKWKLTLSSALLLFLLFALYHVAQFIYLDRWMVSKERVNIEQQMNDTLNYFLERESSFDEQELGALQSFLDNLTSSNQLIRVLDSEGRVLLSVNNELKDEGLQPKPVTETEVLRQSTGLDLLIMRSPLTIHQFTGTIEIAHSMQELTEWKEAIFHAMLIFGLGGLGLCALGGGLLSWQLLKPLQAMTDTIRKIKKSGLQERMKPTNNGDELSELIQLFNEMMDQVERSFSRQKQFVQDASHELRTPISILEGHLAMLQRWGKEHPERLEESLQISREELTRLKRLVQELLVLTRAELSDAELSVSVELLLVKNEIEKVVKSLRPIHRDYYFELDLRLLEGEQLLLDPVHFEQMLLIVLDNAIKYSGASRFIKITGSCKEGMLVIQVSDEGIGIPAEDLPFVMDRFYRVDRARSSQRGSGLGLAIAKRLIERYNGSILIQSKEGIGTTVELQFQQLHERVDFHS